MYVVSLATYVKPYENVLVVINKKEDVYDEVKTMLDKMYHVARYEYGDGAKWELEQALDDFRKGLGIEEKFPGSCSSHSHYQYQEWRDHRTICFYKLSFSKKYRTEPNDMPDPKMKVFEIKVVSLECMGRDGINLQSIYY